MFGATSQEKAYIGPFAVFMGFLALNELVRKIFDGVDAAWWMSEPQFWVFPLQTLVCGWLLVKYWKYYELGPPRGIVWWVGVGILVLLLWIAPQVWLGYPARLDGFDPTYFEQSGAAFYSTVALRFVRLVIVVPLLEEIFWRGFLLRYLAQIDGREIFRGALESIHEKLSDLLGERSLFRWPAAQLLKLTQRLERAVGKAPPTVPQSEAQPFHAVPFGSFSWLSFIIVTAGFTAVHLPEDRVAAAITGMLYNFVAYRTRSLSACVLAHAVTNLLLGIYIMRTGQWGFW